MEDGLDWLYRPLSEGWIQYVELIDGTLGLEDIAEMNEALAIRDENRALIEDAYRNKDR